MANDLLGRIEEWRRKLLDLTNRNQLVSCKMGPRAAIRLEYPSPGQVWSGLLGGADLTFAWKRELVPDANESGDDNNAPPQLSLFASKGEGPPPVEPRITLEQCLESRALSANHLLTDLQDRALGNRLNRMSLNARTALSEQGVNVLFVAFGFLKWFEAEHSDEPRLSPLLLVPVCLERIGATAPWKLSLYEDEITPNFCLRELMKRDFRLELPEVDPQALLDDDQARERYETAVRDAVRNESEWEVLSDAVLGQFSFQKLAMYDDYGRHATEIAEHEHCRRIAGDDSTPPPFALAIPSPERFDAEVHPSKLHTILPCDSSQLEAILAIKAGASLVLDGPPGTGKSQTIANVIAECLADGKTVLFVSEKAAALEVVKQRLDNRNLGDFALNCHSHKASKKEIVTELGRCLNLSGEEYASRDGDLERLYRQRERLNAYVRALHTPQPKLGTSVFDIHGRLAVLAIGTVSRCNIPNVLQIDAATLRDILDRLRALDDCRRVIEEFDQHPWRGCMQAVFSLAFEDEARNRFGSMAEHLTKLDQQLQPLATGGLLASAPTLAEVESGLKSVGKLLHAPSVPVSWLNGHPRVVADAILRIAEWSSAFRATHQECDEFVDEAVDDLWLLREGEMIGSVGDKWSSGLRPHSATTVRKLHSHTTSLSSDLRSLADLSNDVEQAGIAVLDALKIPTGGAQRPAETLLIDIGPKPQASAALSRVWLNADQSEITGESLFATLTDEDEVNAAQAELERHFVSAAFGKRGRDVVRNVRKVRRIWKAVFPKWRLMRKKIEHLYRDKSSRRPSALVRDIEQLRAFLSDSDQHACEVDPHDEALIRDEKGRVCWQSVRNGLQASERLQSLIRVPQQLIDAISSEDRVDRAALKKACERLTTALSVPVQPEPSASLFESAAPIASQFHASDTAKVYALHERLDSSSNKINRLVRLNTEARQSAEELGSVLSVSLVEWPMYRVKVIVEVGRLLAQVASFRRVWFDDIQRRDLRELVNRLSVTECNLNERRQLLEARLKPIVFGPAGRDAAQRLIPFRPLWKKWLPQWRLASKQIQSLYCDSTPRPRAKLLRDATELTRCHAETAQFRDECHAIESAVVRDGEQNIRWQAVLDGIRAVELLQNVGCASAVAIEALCGDVPETRKLLCTASSRLGVALTDAWQAVEELGTILSVCVIDWPLKHIHSIGEVGQLVAQVGVFRRDWFDDAKRRELRETVNRLSATDRELTKRREAFEARLKPISFDPEGRDAAHYLLSFRSFWTRLFPKWRLARRQLESLYHDSTSLARTTLLRDATELCCFHADTARFQDECHALESAFVHDGEKNISWQAVLDGLRAVELLQDVGCASPAMIDALCGDEPETRDGLCSATSQFGVAIADARQAASEIGNVLSVCVEDWPLERLRIIVEVGQLLAQVGIFRRVWFDDTQRRGLPEVLHRLSATDHNLSKQRESMQTRLKPISFGSEGRDIAQRLVPFRLFWKRWLPKWKLARRQSESFYHDQTPRVRSTLFRDAKELSRFHTDISQFHDECRAIESAILRDGEQNIRWQAVIDGISAVELLQDIGCVSPEVIESLCGFESGACECLRSAGSRLGDALRSFEPEIQSTQQLLAKDDICGEHGHAWRSALKYDQTTTLTQMHPALHGLSIELQQAAEWVGELRESTESFRRALTVPIQDPPIGLLTKLVELGQIISETEAFRPVWFEVAKRHDLREMTAKMEAADEQLAARQRDLEERFGPDAFGVKGRQLTARYEEIQSVWQSLFPALQSVRRQAKRMYRGEVPRSPKVIFQEMRRLSRHHLQSAILADEKRVFDGAFIRNEDGTVSLQSVVGATGAVRSLQAGRSMPAAIRDQQQAASQIDRNVFGPACERLETLLSNFEQQFSVVRQRFECSDAGRSAGALQMPTASAYADQLRASSTGVTDHAEKLARVMGLLRDESDVRTDELSGKIKTLQKVRDLRGRIRQQHAEIQTAIGEDGIPEQRDWKGSADQARFLKLLLDEHRDALPAAIANVLVESEHRSQMTAACDAASALMSDRFRSDLDFLRRLFPHTEPVSSGLVICQSTVSTLSEWLRFLVGQLSQLHEWITYRQIEGELTRLGVREVLNELLVRDYSVEQAETAFLARLYRLWLDEAYRADLALGGFRVEDHERIIQDFRTLDRLAIESGTRQIRAKLLSDPERPHAAVFGAPATSEFGILSREVNKKKRHLPLRQLFARVPNLLVRLKPCLMMSPLAVSTYLESSEFKFDVVIFDEASQVLPWDAIGAVYRGRQLVVAGDQKQLPPSTFFDRMVNNDDDSEDADDLGDFESVLDVLCSIGLPRKRLRWHYRSRREPLIAFSNHHFYDDDLVTFPSPDDLDGSTAVRFVHVPEGRWRSKAGFNPIEAKRTAELVLEHIQRHGGRSLGVITFNQKQQLAVLDELMELRKNRPLLEPFFREDRPEPFFVKNLENVQGDERDRIILSVAYGLNEETDRDSMSFGPLNRVGGERRLNVAVTRAREAITLVSSIRSDYIDLNRTKARGARLLRAYLDYAEHGPTGLASKSVETGGQFESPFEEAVANALKEIGLEVRSQIGCGGFRIDLAVVHPEHPGRYVLGIECDGATYHRTATARDRDRIRQEVLEELGWRGRLIRIWSTDWIRNPAHQIERIALAFREALLLPVSAPVEVPEVSPPSPAAEPILRIRDFRDIEPAPRFADIEDVPDGEIARVLLRLAVTFGVTPREDLITSTARELGFGRTGKRISARIESVIQGLVQQGRLRNVGDERLGVTI